MDKALIILLQCGAFILVPLFTLGLGFWLVAHFLGFQHRLAKWFLHC